MKKVLLFKIYLVFFINNIFSDSDMKEYIVIIIHGTLGLYKEIGSNPIKTFLNISRIKKDNSEIKDFIKKENCEFYRDIISENEKLQLLNLENNNLFPSGKFLLNYFNQSFEKIFKDSKKEYYSFGWSGALSHKQRIQYGKILYDQILELIKEKETAGIDPVLIIIGNSHGGNIALNIAEYVNDELNRSIDYLFLVGTPIIKSSNEYIIKKLNNSNEYLFKKVFNIHSEADYVQIGDVISSSNEKIKFSKRLFDTKRKNIFNISFFYAKKNLTEKNIQNIFKDKNVLKALFENIKNEFYFPHHIELIGYLYNKNRICIPISVLSAYIIKIIENSFQEKLNKNQEMQNFFKMIFNINDNSLIFIDLSEEIVIKKLSIEDNFIQNYRKNALEVYNKCYKDLLEKYSRFNFKYYF